MSTSVPLAGPEPVEDARESGRAGCGGRRSRRRASAPRSSSRRSNVRGVERRRAGSARAVHVDGRRRVVGAAAPACRPGPSAPAPSANGSWPSAWSWLPSTAKAPSGASSRASERRRAPSPERRAPEVAGDHDQVGLGPRGPARRRAPATARSGRARRRGGRTGARSGGRRAARIEAGDRQLRARIAAPTGTRTDPSATPGRRDGSRRFIAFIRDVPFSRASDMVGRARPRVTRRTHLCGAEGHGLAAPRC